MGKRPKNDQKVSKGCERQKMTKSDKKCVTNTKNVFLSCSDMPKSMILSDQNECHFRIVLLTATQNLRGPKTMKIMVFRGYINPTASIRPRAHKNT